MNKNNAKRRNKRPECGANAPTFLSTVYNRGTQAKKRQAGAPQYGRSMIEMLGVLAIIGVLSVGGIMGYSKAMFRYKINKTIEQITYIAGNVRTTFASQGNYEGVSDTVQINGKWEHPVWKKSHIFPDDMWKEGQVNPQDMWGNYVAIFSEQRNATDYYKAFGIQYSVSADVCIELASYDWRNAQVKMISVINGWDFYFIPPLDLASAVHMCTYEDYDLNTFNFFFDIDTSDSYWQDYLTRCNAANGGC